MKIFTILFLIIVTPPNSEYIDIYDLPPVISEQCAFSDNEEECTLSSLQEFIFDFEYKGEKQDSLKNKKTYIRFYVELDCTVSDVIVWRRSCGDENFDKQVVKYMSTLPDFYTSGFTGGKEQRFPFIVPFVY